MTHCCVANVYTIVHSQPRLPSRNTAAFEGRAFCLHGNAHIRQYHRVFLNPYYGSRRTCVPLSGLKPGFDEGWESGEGIGKRWEKGENSISGVHIKVGRLVHRDESQHRGWQSGRASESSLCMYVHFDLQPYSSYFFLLFTFFLRRKWDAFHLVAVFLGSTLYGTFRPHIKSHNAGAGVPEKR